MSSNLDINEQPVYGFIGLGAMGYGMCCNLRRRLPKGSRLLICDINPQTLTKFLTEFSECKQEGFGPIHVIGSPRDLALQADIIITILPRGSTVLDVYMNVDESLLSIYEAQSPPENFNKKKLFIDCTTLDAQISAELGQKVPELSKSVAAYADAPVSGGVVGSAAGTLSFMIGCDDKTWEQVEPVCKMMGHTIFHAGPAGTGSVAKILNNYVAAVTTVADCEALNMAAKFGIDPKRLTEIINASGGQNWTLSHLNPCPEAANAGTAPSRGYEGGFAIELFRDVVKLGMNLSNNLGTKSIVGPAVVDLLENAAQDPRCAGHDARSIYLYIAQREYEVAEGIKTSIKK